MATQAGLEEITSAILVMLSEDPKELREEVYIEELPDRYAFRVWIGKKCFLMDGDAVLWMSDGDAKWFGKQIRWERDKAAELVMPDGQSVLRHMVTQRRIALWGLAEKLPEGARQRIHEAMTRAAEREGFLAPGHDDCYLIRSTAMELCMIRALKIALVNEYERVGRESPDPLLPEEQKAPIQCAEGDVVS